MQDAILRISFLTNLLYPKVRGLQSRTPLSALDNVEYYPTEYLETPF